MNILQAILEARQERANLRRRIASTGHASLSLSLNVPGHPKSSTSLNRFFDLVLTELHHFLRANRILMDESKEIRHIDAAGDFYIATLSDAPDNLKPWKDICESFEETHPVGRLIDIDITSRDGEAVSSQKAKACFICEFRPALFCMRDQRHSKDELRSFIFKQVDVFLAEQHKDILCRRLSTLATKAVLYEISLSPKPGSVDRFDPGSHEDMDFFTFINSSAAISPFFCKLARSGYDVPGIDALAEALPFIRSIGLQAEDAMFNETNGINTQKGLIFLAGITLYAAASVLRRHDGRFSKYTFMDSVKAITYGICQRELPIDNNDLSESQLTHGQMCARKYGLPLGGGVRYEAEMGFPTIFDHGLPVLEKHLGHKPLPVKEADVKEALTDTLLAIMAANNDSNILYRKGPRQLEEVKRRANDILTTTHPGQKELKYSQLQDYCKKENISPGGSSDLLAVTLLIFFIQNEYNPG